MMSLFANNKSEENSNQQTEENYDDLATLIVDTEEKLQNLIAILQKQTQIDKPTAWDTETDSLDTQSANLVGIGCCWGENCECM